MPLLYIYLFSRIQTQRDVDKGNRSVAQKHHFYPFQSHHQSMASHALDLTPARLKRHRQGKVPMLLRCVGPKQAVLVMAEVHEGIDGAHQAGPRMRWLIHKHGFYWPSMEKDCIEYAKGCQACQKHGPIQQKVSSRTRSRRHLSFFFF